MSLVQLRWLARLLTRVVLHQLHLLIVDVVNTVLRRVKLLIESLTRCNVLLSLVVSYLFGGEGAERLPALLVVPRLQVARLLRANDKPVGSHLRRIG